MKQFFGNTFWQAIAVTAILYGLALLIWQRDFGSFAFGVTVGAMILSFVWLERGLMLVFIELFSNLMECC